MQLERARLAAALQPHDGSLHRVAGTGFACVLQGRSPTLLAMATTCAGGQGVPHLQARRYRSAVQFRLLGPLAASGDDGPIAVGGPKQRLVLAHLLLRLNT